MSAVTRTRRCISFSYSGGCAAGRERKGELVTNFQQTSVGCQERKRRERGGGRALSLCQQENQSLRVMQLHMIAVSSR